ncbi:MAG: DUF3060 domain-containing protein [Mycolicibacterium sp.]|nr:DUF3060 domain-containing protein [Mycolicibacterium sp.]
MSTHSRAGLAAALLVAMAVAGCGSEDDRAGAQVEVANTINYGSFGTSADIDCGAGKSLNVGGSNNTLRVSGACATVSVGGADNKITLERVDGELSVVGLNNTVTYRHGEPDVNDAGSGNRITAG